MRVQRTPCTTCIYRRDSRLSLKKLEDQVRDPNVPGDFSNYRVCHHTPNQSKICCQGFWQRHKNHFALGQIAQRLGIVEFVDVDTEKRMDEEQLVCTNCEKPVPLTRQRAARMRLLRVLGKPVRVYCNDACNTQYWNKHGRSKTGHWSKYGDLV